MAVELAQGGILYGHRFALGLVCRVFLLAPLRAGRRVGVDFGSRRPDGGVGTLLAGLAGLGTYFLASPGCSRELAPLAFGKLAERVDLIAFVETGAGDVFETATFLARVTSRATVLRPLPVFTAMSATNAFKFSF